MIKRLAIASKMLPLAATRFLALAVIASILSSCTTVTAFAVLNESKKSIEVIYTLPKASGSNRSTCPDDIEFQKPRVQMKASIDDLRFSNGKQNPVAEFKCDEVTGDVTIQLSPGQAVGLFRLLGYGGHPTEEDAKSFRYLERSLATLRLRGQAGEMQFSGTQVTRDFQEWSGGLYVLAFKG